jgi:hypothetical protein
MSWRIPFTGIFGSAPSSPVPPQLQSPPVNVGQAGYVLTGGGGSGSITYSSGIGTTTVYPYPVSASSGSASTLSYSGLTGSPLTPEEVKELEGLQQELDITKKALRLSEFKKLPKELRQFVVTAATWQQYLININQLDIQPSARQLELYSKNLSANWAYSGSTGWFQGNFAYTVSIPIPDGLSIEDLIAAHTDQSMEEEILSEKSDIE